MLEKLEYTNIIILCIGTCRLVGDSVGPIVGDLLNKRLNNERIVIYGRNKKVLRYEKCRLCF